MWNLQHTLRAGLTQYIINVFFLPTYMKWPLPYFLSDILMCITDKTFPEFFADREHIATAHSSPYSLTISCMLLKKF